MTSAEEFILIPKHLYLKEQPDVKQIIQSKNIADKAAYLTLLQRNTPQDGEEEELTLPPDRIQPPIKALVQQQETQTERPVLQDEATLTEQVPYIKQEQLPEQEEQDPGYVQVRQKTLLPATPTTPQAAPLTKDELVKRIREGGGGKLNEPQMKKILQTYDILQSHPAIEIDRKFRIVIDGQATNAYIITFLLDLQKTTKKIDSDYEEIIQTINLPENLTSNTFAKQAIKKQASLLAASSSMLDDESASGKTPKWESFSG